MQILGILMLCAGVSVKAGPVEEPEHWIEDGRRDIRRAMEKVDNYGIAKNTVLMIGDGMGIPSVTAGRIYKGQLNGQNGEEYKLSFEDFPNVALSKTYNVDRQVADSAATAYAMVSGIKANMGTLGVNSKVANGASCETYREDREVETALDFALKEGKSVGIVTTTRVTHATPAAMYAHTPLRYWEDDAAMAGVNGCDKVKDIALQLIEDNTNINVILGGGRRVFYDKMTPDPSTGDMGRRLDSRNLVQEWINEKAERDVKYASVLNKGEFDNVDPGNTDYLLGLFSPSNMAYDLQRSNQSNGEPSLAEMADKAIRILKKNPKGFFLMIEGGRIDHAHHDNFGKLALGDMVAFDDAVIKVKELTSPVDTLTIVTADHSHVFGMTGYPSRGNNILGTVDIVDPSEVPFDGMPYTTLTYSNGPQNIRQNYTNMDTTANDFQQYSGIGMKWEKHGGEEVAIYAHGPMSHLFHSTHEQSYIGHVIHYSSCYGLYKNKCDIEKRKTMATIENVAPLCSANLGQYVSPVVIFIAVGIALWNGARIF